MRFRFFGPPSTGRSPLPPRTDRARETVLDHAGSIPVVPRLPAQVLPAPKAGTISRRRWRRRQRLSPLTILANHFLRGRKWSGAEWLHRTKTGKSLESFAPPL